MIKYKLSCKDCDLSFDSWFASSKEFERLRKKNFLTCHICNSKKIEKSLMAPKIINKSSFRGFEKKKRKNIKISEKIKDYQKFIKSNFEFVGENFAYEARSIHYDTKKKNKAIYGTATKDEIKELKEEGIKAELIPWIEDKNN